MKKRILCLGFGKLAIIVVVILAAGWFVMRRDDVRERVIPSKSANESKDVIFAHVAKQFAFKVPESWAVSESSNGFQTFIYPTKDKVSSGSISSLLQQNVIIIEVVGDKSVKIDSLTTTLKDKAKKDGFSVKEEEKEFNKLKAKVIRAEGEYNYAQILFDAPTIYTLTYKENHPVADDVLKTFSIDLSPYASQIAEISSATRTVKDNINQAKFNDLYQNGSEGLKKTRTVEEIDKLLKGVSTEFNNNVLIWGVFINPKIMSSSVNIVNGGNVIRRGTFFFVKENDKLALDGLKLSPKMNEKSPAKDEASSKDKTKSE